MSYPPRPRSGGSSTQGGPARILLWLMSTLTVLVLLFGYRTSLGGSDVASAMPIVGSVSSPADTSAGASGRSPSGTAHAGSAPPATPDPATPTAARTVTGPVAQTAYGPVQVQLRVTGSGSSVAITDVSVLQYPHSSGQDAQINGYALPILIQETVDAQSAQIDMVSGATYTSTGYEASLQAALDQARA